MDGWPGIVPTSDDFLLSKERLKCLLIFVLSNQALYVQVAVHRDKLRIKQPTRCINLMFL